MKIGIEEVEVNAITGIEGFYYVPKPGNCDDGPYVDGFMFSVIDEEGLVSNEPKKVTLYIDCNAKRKQDEYETKLAET